MQERKKEAEEKNCRAVILTAVHNLEQARAVFGLKKDLNAPFEFKVRKPVRRHLTANASGICDQLCLQVHYSMTGD